MILYKYYGFSSGLSALRTSQLGFREPESFNDPFELTFLDNSSGLEVKLNDLDSKIQSLKKSVAILSLTRAPLNPLMWAHYGEEHRGFVIGYDVDTPFLMDEKYSIVPVDRGDVVYTNTKTVQKLTPSSRRLLHQLYLSAQGLQEDTPNKSELENLARKIFLTKHSSWVYEEEVRVVKTVQSIFETVEEYSEDPLRQWYSINKVVAPAVSTALIPGLKIYEPKVSIREVFLGVRNPLLSERDTPIGQVSKRLSEKALDEGWKVYAARMSRGSWELGKEIVDSSSLDIFSKERGLINSSSLSGAEIVEILSKFQNENVSQNDSVEVTNWNGQIYIQKNDDFI